MVEITDPDWVSLEKLIEEKRMLWFKRGTGQDLSKKRNLLERTIWGVIERVHTCAVYLRVIHNNKNNKISL